MAKVIGQRTQIPNQARRIVGKIQHDKEKKMTLWIVESD